jgi:hypothetical protein
MRLIIIRDNIVDNVVAVEPSTLQSTKDHYLATVPGVVFYEGDNPASSGDIYDPATQTFTAPPQPEPETPPAKRILTKLEFRRKLTDAERPYIDEFNATFESNGLLTVEQKRAIRSGLEDYKVAQEVNLDDPQTQAMVQLYEALGLIAAGRATEILS